MLMRLGLFAGAMIVMAVVVPDMATSYIAWRADQMADSAEVPAAAEASSTASASGRSAVLPAGAGGHFYGTFTINGRKQDGLIDTGASTVAINLSAAQRLGLSPNKLVFDTSVDTANGRIKAARVQLDKMTIGPVSVGNVDALVLPDTSLSGMLVGMSFLGKLSSYKVQNNRLYLLK